MITATAMLAAGFVLLIVASGRFVTGAAAVAFRLRLSPVVVGAVVVGFGTSAPELLASTLAAVQGARDVAVGNVVGSNMANLTLVLGVVALVASPRIASRVLLREAPVMVAALLLLAATLGALSRGGGLLLLVAFTLAMTVLLRSTRVDEDPLAEETDRRHGPAGRRSWPALGLLTVGGLLGTVLGAQLLVSGARVVADAAGLAEGFVGFTLVALGTSLPEVVTGVQAARRGEPDLAVGNVLGSNLFNSLAIAGVVALVSPGPVDAGLLAAAWVTVVVGLAVWLLMATARRVVRWEGAALVAGYLATLPLVA